MGFVDALFTATSGVTTTGLTVVDTGSFLSLFGQIVLLLLIQIGGLGYMVLIVSIVYALREKPSMGASLAMRESAAGVPAASSQGFVWTVILTTFIFEASGAVILGAFWTQEFPVGKAIYFGIFHSISAFCTAGFGLFSDSFSSYQVNPIVNIVLPILSIVGGIGFFVIYDLLNQLGQAARRVRSQLSVHTKLAISTSLILMLVGTAVIFVFDTRFMPGSPGLQLVGASFQSISAATTTGFNTINIGAMSGVSLLIMILLMFVGSSPGSTGGGIKTTTFALMLSTTSAVLKEKPYINVFDRRISQEQVKKAFVIGLISVLVVCFGVLIFTIVEDFPLLSSLFEVTSAFGTVGLSTGITPSLSALGKVTLSVIMLIGRVGPLTVGLGLFGRPKSGKPVIRNAEAQIFIG